MMKNAMINSGGDSAHTQNRQLRATRRLHAATNP
jgi:hypothetical protein